MSARVPCRAGWRLTILAVTLASTVGFAWIAQARPRPVPVSTSVCTGLAPVEAQKCLKTVRESQPVFIFIPGILGSALKSENGDVLWGTTGGKTDRLLLTPTSEPVVPSELGSFQVGDGLYDRDIYGRMAEEIRRLDVGDIAHFLMFPYDWRQDNRISAERLEEWLTRDVVAQIKGRTVIFVAHSMGGLVFRYWYSKYKKGKPTDSHAFTLDQVLFLAVPHVGAPQALYRIVEAKLFDSVGERLAGLVWNSFHNLEKVAYSFPSLYQLLPQAPCTVIRAGADCATGYVPLFEPRTWEQLHLLKKVAEAAGQSEVNILQVVSRYISDAATFHQEIPACNAIPNATFFSSSSEETLISATVDNDNELQWTRGMGDKTVPKDIAACGNIAPQFDIDVEGDHIGIAKADFFLKFIERLRTYALSQRGVRFATMIQSDRAFATAFAISGNVLAVPPESLISDSDVATRILAANLEIQKIAHEAGVTLSFANAPKTAEMDILRTALLPPGRQKAEAAQRVGYYFHKEGDALAKTFHEGTVDSLKAFKLADAYTSKVIGVTGSQLPDDLLGAAHNTKGAALARLGRFDEAKAEYTIAATKFGKELAERNLKAILKGGGL